MKIYVGCSLTHAPREFVLGVEQLKKELRRRGYEVFEFLGLTEGTPTDVYRQDIRRCVANCDILVAICDIPSTGLGWELGTAVERYAKPTLAVAHLDSKVTRLVLGAEQDNPCYQFRRYNDLSQVADFVDEIVTGSPAQQMGLPLFV